MLLKHSAVLVLCIGFASSSRVARFDVAGDDESHVDKEFAARQMKESNKKPLLKPCTDCGIGPVSALELASQKAIHRIVTRHRMKHRTMRARREARRSVRKAHKAKVQRRSIHKGGLALASSVPTDTEESKPTDAGSAETDQEETQSAGGEGADPEEGGETAVDEKEVVRSTADKIWMQTGWLVLFVGFLLTSVCYLALTDLLWDPPDEKVQVMTSLEHLGQESRSFSEFVMKQLNGLGRGSSALNAIIIGLGVWNIYTYAVETEMKWDADYKLLGYPIDRSKIYVEKFSLVFLSLITLARIATVHTHPDWIHYGATAPVRYAIANIYTFVELIALGVTYYSFMTYETRDHLDLLWLFLLRSCEMLARDGGGLGFKRLKHMITDDGKLLLVAFVFGQVVWLIMSGLYFMANHDNEDAIWEAENFARFQSIPSSMWYVLINLLKEHPLADVHTTFFQRVLCIIVCIFAMPVFAIPTSILQNALFHKDDGDEEEVDMRQRRTDAQVQHLAELQAESLGSNFYLGLGTFLLCLGSILTYFYHTAEGQPEGKSFFWIPVSVDFTTFAMVDGAVAVCFLGEYAWRVSIGGGDYAFSLYGLIDLWAWLPGLYNVCTYETVKGSAHSLLCAACVLRILKLERYLHSFRDMIDIVKENRSILSATVVLTALIWSFFSVMFFLTERSNADEEMNEEVYGSVLRSMWAEVINLHGEWPWADYTVLGKAVGTVVGFFSIMLFCIPISIFGNGFQEKVKAERGRSSEDEELDRRPWQLKIQPEKPGWLYDIFYGHLRGKRGMASLALRSTLTLLLVATTLVSIFSTVKELEELRKVDTAWGMACLYVDIAAVAVFSMEYLARLVATGGRHAISFVGMMEVISLVAIGYTCLPGKRDAFTPSYDDPDVMPDCIVVLRLLHLWSMDNWIHSVNTMKNVFFLNRWPMARAGGALVSTWFTHATLMYLCENPKAFGEPADAAATPVPQQGEEDDDGEVSMAYRYRSILSALQYSIVHLFGDYPETDYTFAAKAVQFAAILGGIAIISTFCGVFSAGFVDYLEAMRADEKKEKRDKMMRTALRIRSGMKRALQRTRARLTRGEPSPPSQPMPPFRRMARSVSFAQPGLGKLLRHLFEAVVIVALINSLVSSVPEIDQMEWGPSVTNGIEFACTCIFGLEYLILFVSSPKKAFSFWGLLALVCCLPGVLIAVFKPNPEGERMIEAFGMLRAMRILNFAYFQKETRIISLSLGDALPKLAIPAYISLNVWITTSALFMWLENEYDGEPGNGGGTAEDMPDVPSALYFCSIFLTGEWANVDFTYAGSRLCIFYVVFGIAMFSMPVGIIVEAVQSTLMLVHQEERNMKKLLKQQSDNSLSSSMQDAKEQQQEQQTQGSMQQQPWQQPEVEGAAKADLPAHWQQQGPQRPTWMAQPDQGSFEQPGKVLGRLHHFRQRGWF
eukprot:TRINITY_DN3133_c0_g1_i1.p1 TRINITY_DN3133_c0_g1~~TRINITY_DN3133_c0_g1_i1.p1  ORF type:complete len:1438 (-),score=279.88 TRINITY_DN3133_c0_g1_i1:1306-5619(-)